MPATEPPSAGARPQGRPERSDRDRPTPRRIRHGLRLRSRDGVNVSSEMARWWLAAVEQAFDAEARSEGHAYARSGQIATMDFVDGRIDASVQGREARPYATVVDFGVFDAEKWDHLVALMAGEAVHVAKMLDNDITEPMRELFEEQGARLLPAAADELVCRCSCTDEGRCKHAAAVCFLLAERFDQDPGLIFSIRGIPRSRLLERLRQVRAIQTHGVASAHADPHIPESEVPPVPLEESLETFWRTDRPAVLRDQSRSEWPSHALLRRLGPSPLNGRFPLVGLMASIYDAVAEATGQMSEQVGSGGDGEESATEDTDDVAPENAE